MAKNKQSSNIEETDSKDEESAKQSLPRKGMQVRYCTKPQGGGVPGSNDAQYQPAIITGFRQKPGTASYETHVVSLTVFHDGVVQHYRDVPFDNAGVNAQSWSFDPDLV